MDLDKLREFKKTEDYAELQKLSEISLTRPLTDEEFQEMMKLKEKLDLIL
jgi:predicted RNA-binding protein with PUA-like domain